MWCRSMVIGVAAAITGVLVLGGCGTEASDGTEPSTSTPAASTASTVAPLTPEQIRYRDAMGLTDDQARVAFTFSCSLHDVDLDGVTYANQAEVDAEASTTTSAQPPATGTAPG